jgi:hypothetical protein
MEYLQPKMRTLVSERDRWSAIAHQYVALYSTLDEYLGRCLGACACVCSAMTLAENYHIVSLTVPKEVISLAKQRKHAVKVGMS